ncbi:unnamed protein product, partial [Discosporangium mesarthrocarpum]
SSRCGSTPAALTPDPILATALPKERVRKSNESIPGASDGVKKSFDVEDYPAVTWPVIGALERVQVCVEGARIWTRELKALRRLCYHAAQEYLNVESLHSCHASYSCHASASDGRARFAHITTDAIGAGLPPSRDSESNGCNGSSAVAVKCCAQSPERNSLALAEALAAEMAKVSSIGEACAPVGVLRSLCESHGKRYGRSEEEEIERESEAHDRHKKFRHTARRLQSLLAQARRAAQACGEGTEEGEQVQGQEQQEEEEWPAMDLSGRAGGGSGGSDAAEPGVEEEELAVFTGVFQSCLREAQGQLQGLLEKDRMARLEEAFFAWVGKKHPPDLGPGFAVRFVVQVSIYKLEAQTDDAYSVLGLGLGLGLGLDHTSSILTQGPIQGPSRGSKGGPQGGSQGGPACPPSPSLTLDPPPTSSCSSASSASTVGCTSTVELDPPCTPPSPALAPFYTAMHTVPLTHPVPNPNPNPIPKLEETPSGVGKGEDKGWGYSASNGW